VRLRLYGAQLTPGTDPGEYVKTITPQQISANDGALSLRWGDTTGFDLDDPSWTVHGARFKDGDVLTSWMLSQVVQYTYVPYMPPTSTSFSAAIKLITPLPRTIAHVTDYGGSGLGVLRDGTLSWWIGNDHYPTNTKLDGSQYVHLFYTVTPTEVNIWVNGQHSARLPIANSATPTKFWIGGYGARFDLAAVSFYESALPASNVPSLYVYYQYLSQRLGLDQQFWYGDHGVLGYNVLQSGTGFYDLVYAQLPGYTAYQRTFTLSGSDYQLTYFTVAP
jgi:hypothetical protein